MFECLPLHGHRFAQDVMTSQPPYSPVCSLQSQLGLRTPPMGKDFHPNLAHLPTCSSSPSFGRRGYHSLLRSSWSMARGKHEGGPEFHGGGDRSASHVVVNHVVANLQNWSLTPRFSFLGLSQLRNLQSSWSKHD